MNIALDFDFKGREPTSLATTDLVKFSKKVAKIVGASNIVLTKRTSSYLKVTKKEQCHAFGFHLWIIGKFSLPQCQEVRDGILSEKLLNPLRRKYNFYNSDEDAVDKSPALRANGLYLVGDRKLGLVASPHFICYANGKELEYGWQATDRSLFCGLLEEMYGFIWEPKGTEQVLKPPSSKVKHLVIKPSSPLIRVVPSAPPVETESRFNLPLFLEVTKGHVANNREWKQLCVFWCSEGLDARKTNDMCEQAWGPFRHTCNTPRRKNSTFNFMRKVNRFDVTKASHD